MTRFIATAAAAFAAIALTAPAMASDPDTSPTAKQEWAKVSGRAKSVRLCRPESSAPDAKTVCKTRGQWIREGRDPLAAN